MHYTVSLGNKKIQKKSVSKDPNVIPIHKADVCIPIPSRLHTYSLDNLKTT